MRPLSRGLTYGSSQAPREVDAGIRPRTTAAAISPGEGFRGGPRGRTRRRALPGIIIWFGTAFGRSNFFLPNPVRCFPLEIYIDKIRFDAYTVNIEEIRYEVSGLGSVHRENARVFKAFCDVNRLMILELLRSGEKCACVLLEKLRIGQSTLSYHMKILCDSGVVDSRQEGKWTHYRISEKGGRYALELLRALTTPDENPVENRCSTMPANTSSDEGNEDDEKR